MCGDDHDDFEIVLGDDVSVSNSEKGRAGEVDAIQVFGFTVGLRFPEISQPIFLIICFGDKIEHDCLNKRIITKKWRMTKILNRKSLILL